jgi:hypothetical protein
MHAVVCDFPLPWTPQTNAENGTLVLRKSLESMIVVEEFGSELPRSPYCGRSFSEPGHPSKSAEKITAFLRPPMELSSLLSSVTEEKLRRPS